MAAIIVLLILTAIQALVAMGTGSPRAKGQLWRAAVMHGLTWWAYCTVPT